MTSPDDAVEAVLRDIGTRLAVPEPPDVTAAVLARLAEPTRAPRRWRPVHRLIAAAVAALLALATAMVVSPAVRAAVYDLLRIGGVEIHENEPAPAVPPVEAPLPGEREVSLPQARAAAAFELTVPASLGEPDTVRLIDGSPPRVVSMSFGTVRVDQFDGGLDPIFSKFAHADDVRQARIGAAHGIWVDRPHPVLYTDRAGGTHEEAARLAGSTLIWESGGVTYRVEGNLTRDQALAIAESMR